MPDPAGLGRHDGRFGVGAPLAFPEVRPGTAPNGGEVAHLHDALAALAHEDQLAVEVENLDAIAGGRQDAAEELGVRAVAPILGPVGLCPREKGDAALGVRQLFPQAERLPGGGPVIRVGPVSHSHRLQGSVRINPRLFFLNST